MATMVKRGKGRPRLTTLDLIAFRARLDSTLLQTAGNVAMAARIMGMHWRTIYRRIEQVAEAGLEPIVPDDYRPGPWKRQKASHSS